MGEEEVEGEHNKTKKKEDQQQATTKTTATKIKRTHEANRTCNALAQARRGEIEMY